FNKTEKSYGFKKLHLQIYTRGWIVPHGFVRFTAETAGADDRAFIIVSIYLALKLRKERESRGRRHESRLKNHRASSSSGVGRRLCLKLQALAILKKSRGDFGGREREKERGELKVFTLATVVLNLKEDSLLHGLGPIVIVTVLCNDSWTPDSTIPRQLIQKTSPEEDRQESGDNDKEKTAGCGEETFVEVEGMLKITARVVPMTKEDSRIHGYNVTEDDCLAHQRNVDGVLGLTYRSNYIGVHMPVMGGDREFQTTRLFAPDCSAARFTGNRGSNGGQRDDGVVDVLCSNFQEFIPYTRQMFKSDIMKKSTCTWTITITTQNVSLHTPNVSMQKQRTIQNGSWAITITRIGRMVFH
ncbi:hypothetical protein HID58_067729, partial [Brassica napus]